MLAQELSRSPKTMQKNVETKRSVFLTVVCGAIGFLCLRTLLLLSSASHGGRRPGTAHVPESYFLWPKRSEIYQEEGDLDGVPTAGLVNLTAVQRQEWIVANLPNFQILQSDDKSRFFSRRVESFLQGLGGEFEDVMRWETGGLQEGSSEWIVEQGKDSDMGEHIELLSGSLNATQLGGNDTETEQKRKYECDMNIFMIWISPVSHFGPREQLSIESLFKTHPLACLVILSRSLDSDEGKEHVLQQFLHRDFKVLAVTPDIPQLFEGTPASVWYDRLTKGMVDPGHISFSQNLSNLMRLVALYKYGGLYMDSDIIVLRNFSFLGNVIGSQQSNDQGEWTKLNNAVLKFSKGHPLMLKCIDEFAFSFNGNKWGHNGPFLATRVLSRLRKHSPHGEEWQCDILPPSAFYPVDWLHFRAFVLAPRSHSDKLRHLSTIQDLETNSYTLHLWNKETRGFKVQHGSILETMFRHRCVICNETTLEAAIESQSSI